MKELAVEKVEKKLTLKMFLCIIYLIVITILFSCSYKIFQEKYQAKPWSEVESVEEYSYITVSKMSEKFAYYEEEDIGFHFVIEEEETGLWHTYIIGIKEAKYDKYKEIIDYTYERTEEAPTPIKICGYPEIITTDLKEMAIKNIENFVPAENEIKITDENFETYLTNSYLDTTKERSDYFSILLFLLLLLLFIMIFVFLFTIFDVNNDEESIFKRLFKLTKENKTD